MDAVDDTSARLASGAVAGPPEPERQPSLLIVVVDLTLSGWSALEPEFTFSEAIAQLMIFINAHLAMHNLNEVALLSYGDFGVQFHFHRETRTELESEQNYMEDSMYRKFALVNAAIVQGLEQTFRSDRNVIEAAGSSGHCSVAGGLSVALCYASRIQRVSPSTMPRVLVLSVSSDQPRTHVATMNCVFAAQKMHIPLDVCNLQGRNTFLQQAAMSTHGAYIDFDKSHSLLQYLLSAFAVDPAMRRHVNLASQYAVDFTAVCYVTKEKLHIGQVCSVCLIVLKQLPASGRCPVCNTDFLQSTDQECLEKDAGGVVSV